ncbi:MULTISPECIES: CbiQ family ECF transporter T component [Anoxybacillus]|uniref:Cobalt/nickel transport system permease protein n=1 Tax=Anoxybacillus mongoliensis TaxID=452565 RepID=A0A7W8JEK3_9BACL|nr:MULTISPECIES: CbiQ family ECF transporter T component [Anoxybacillus]MBB5354318.1 cobalt/nickel transport system permease protein [Anoxybacillus mongoliensis]NNU95544.1 cobalt ABC transporter permease [Anoxybacillus sp. EFIL]
MVSWLDEWAYRNKLAKLNVTFKLTLTCMLLIWALCGTNVVRCIIIVWLFVWLLYHARLPWRVCVRFFIIMGLIIIGSCVPLLFTVDRTIHFVSENMAQAATICLRALASSFTLFFLAITTPFFRIAHALSKWHVPKAFIELLLLTYRFIFVLEKAAMHLFMTVRTKNGERSWHLASLAVAQLFRQTMREYEATIIAQEARNVSFVFPICADEQLPRKYVIETCVWLVVLLMMEGLYVNVS